MNMIKNLYTKARNLFKGSEAVVVADRHAWKRMDLTLNPRWVHISQAYERDEKGDAFVPVYRNKEGKAVGRTYEGGVNKAKRMCRKLGLSWHQIKAQAACGAAVLP